ncbi:glycosyltransferase [Herbiconiux sp. CPCC 205763]|uniref:Glycosyltransferase n=1 Tax=Herbiconiux aconitum TaxID=2970913 RepID=A0ABT2GPR2_9MICO|nr:glycosyltransferase [Herbiconiux aconitum]MCS5716761.1 glycosyltransferase [Herbiconiux aconitum]
MLVRLRPSVVVLMLPPAVAVWVVAPLAVILKFALIGDLHSGVFNDRRWAWAAPSTLRILKRRGGAIVTNETLARIPRAAQVRTLVMHDLIDASDFSKATVPTGPLDALVGEKYLLVPVTYASDEPIAELLRAARGLPEVKFVLTGRAPEEVRAAAPKNVVFSGFVSDEVYSWLLVQSAAVMALTTRESTMQRAGYEALAAGKPLVTSNTEALREYFTKGAVFVEPTVDSLASGILDALGRGALLASEMSDLAVDLEGSEQQSLIEFRGWVDTLMGSN